MQKEDWINGVLDSVKNIKRAEAPPFLYERIINRIERPGQPFVHQTGQALKWGLAVSAAVLLTLNVISVKKVTTEKRKVSETWMKDYDKGFNHSVIYNY